MEVHLICSRRTLMEKIDQLRTIVKVIKMGGHRMSQEWIEGAYSSYLAKSQHNWPKIYQETLETIARTDVLIAECSHENFGVGFEVALAIQHRKPVLLLRHEDIEENSFSSGVEAGWVVRKRYNDHTLRPIIEEFLDDNNIRPKDMRFNFFIDRKIHNYLRWASYKTGKTKSEILRNLVEKEIDKPKVS